MLRVVVHASAAAARQYYAEGLAREDYYSEGQEVVGKWYGEAAAMLGLSGDVTPEAFAALVENKHPLTGERLTQRTKEGRRVGYDLNFHAPKSLSLLYAVTQDKAVLSAFRSAVAETMTELEELAATRVRQKGGRGNRLTGNLAWAEFVHFTARPVGGVPDPHLHVHCFTFNATFDSEEGRWKAAEFAAIKKEAHYAEAAFHSRLTAKLKEQGYGIERTKTGWELAGIPASVIAKFSRRTAQIEKLAAELGITDAKAKDALGASSREGKRHGLTFSDLLALWGQRLTEEEKTLISKAAFDKPRGRTSPLSAKEAVDYALAKVFERQSVAPRGHILAAALRFAYGQTTPEAIKAEFERRGLIGRKIGDDHICTTIDVLAEEVALINAVRSSRNTSMRLGGRGTVSGPAHFSAEQHAAVRHVMSSRDQVIAIKGAAGVGKTTVMKEVVAAIERRGTQVFAFAPSADASRGTLREAGFSNADTVAQLLVNQRLQQRVRGQVIWVDEAGLLGVQDFLHLLTIAGNDTRIILTGDTDQHGPVARGDPFRLLQQYAGVKVATLSQIRRQELAEYRKAIESLAKGDLRTGFRRLDALGAFVEIEDDAARYEALAADYIGLGGKKGEFPLVVSPTHAEGAKVTAIIRAAKFEAGQLAGERSFLQYHNLQWTEAERLLPENYHAGLTVQFNQNAKGVRRGELFTVIAIRDSGKIEVRGSKGEKRILDLKEAGKFSVFEQRQIRIAKGEQIRITRNGDSKNGKRLNNGNTFTVKEFTKGGDIILGNGAKLGKDHGHFTYGYCQTSHSSQSKSVRHVLVAQSENSFLAASKEQFYVSCSRGKQTIRIYTDNRQVLQEAVGGSSARMAGVELAGLTSKDIASLMQQELGARQWRDAVQSRRGVDGAKGFVQHLIEQRRMDPLKKDGAMSWRGYIEMRRNLSGPDGKSRSKGHPAPERKGGIQNKGKSWPKVNQLSDKLTAQHKATHEAKKAEKQAPKKETNPRKAAIEKAQIDSAKHFGKAAGKAVGRKSQQAGPKKPGERVIRMGRTEVKPKPAGMLQEAKKHTSRQKSAAINKQQAKTRQQSKAPPPPASKRK